MRCAQAGAPAPAARGIADKKPRTLDRAGGDSGPNPAPGEMRNGQHGARVNLRVGLRQDLSALARRPQLNPELQVPRIPSVSQPTRRSRV